MTKTNEFQTIRLEVAGTRLVKGRDVKSRFEQHLSGSGSAQTKLFKPVSLRKTIESVSAFEKDKTTKELMALFSIVKVRGGSYAQLVSTQ